MSVRLSEINRLIDEKNKAVKLLEAAILKEMARVAKIEQLDEMQFLFVNTFIRKGKEVASEAISRLDTLYCNEIHPNGFQGVWKKDKGWV